MDNYGQEVDCILWEQQRADIPPKIIWQYLESLDQEAVSGQAPPAVWVAEAYENARVHLRNFDATTENSDACSISSAEEDCCSRKWLVQCKAGAKRDLLQQTEDKHCPSGPQ